MDIKQEYAQNIKNSIQFLDDIKSGDMISKFVNKLNLDIIDKINNDIISILISKGKDYSDPNADPYKNFRTSEIIDIPINTAVMVRMLDKISRVKNLSDKEPSVLGESLLDSLMDIIGYSCLINSMEIDTGIKPVNNLHKVLCLFAECINDEFIKNAIIKQKSVDISFFVITAYIIYMQHMNKEA